MHIMFQKEINEVRDLQEQMKAKEQKILEEIPSIENNIEIISKRIQGLFFKHKYFFLLIYSFIYLKRTIRDMLLKQRTTKNYQRNIHQHTKRP